ncbi:hypothetical protein AQJ46_04000 [Streptomyces canus]|uniref:Uncharacterized protein n=2 Tax=Streptomyces TaxID=1883 RepID=A0A124I0K9_9ACTN|nr:hypothetical protein AQJ46_04000 [Streptomyces canus]
MTGAVVDALAHPAAGIGAEEVAASMRVHNARAAEHAGATPRTHADVTRFFDDTELLDPGVVQLPEWRPEADSGPGALPMSCGVGRKPL